MTRKTGQRKAIRNVFERTNRPLTPQEVLNLAQEEIPALGIATVYRNLKTLHESGWLKAVELPGEPTRYEPAEMAHHHHFHCDSCGLVYDIPGCPSDMKGLVPTGFTVRSHDIILVGLCSECSHRNLAPVQQ